MNKKPYDLHKNVKLEKDKHLNSKEATIRIIIYYVFLGFAWILTSDYIVDFLFDDPEVYARVQSVKGILYVLITAVVFYAIIFHRIDQYVSSLVNLNQAYEDLDLSHENSLKLENQLYRLAYYDELTGLPNKILLHQQIDKLIKKVKDKSQFAFIYFDIDEFRHVNEILGHHTGDELIKMVSERLSKSLNQEVLIARMSGDEFVLVLEIQNLDEAKKRIYKIFDLLRGEYALNLNDYFITFSVGVAIYPEHGKDYISLLRHADVALSHAKSNRKDQIIIFDNEMIISIENQASLSNQLRGAIAHHEFSIHYQPVIKIETMEVSSVEALLRWTNRDGKNIPPLDFIPFSEKNGFIHDITEWVFNQTSKDFSGWNSKDDFSVSINLSPVVLSENIFIQRISEWVKRFKFQPKNVILEITETAVIDDLEKSINVLNQLKDLGFTIALDDFGTGYSSLTYLQKLPIDIVKIDRSFISSIFDHQADIFILKGMVDLAHHLEMEVVAEGIETKAQHDLMKKLSIDYGQGYYYSKPAKQSEIIEKFDQIKQEKEV
ncbi:MAG: EAL domain-containing protein [Acholeplasmataceae bacterium]|nr:EAL domain-containing protein [Acholeplasmataceae bacterium]MDY0338864.1 EAL domain-containing protein [Acholeplasmataceae bacterium]